MLNLIISSSGKVFGRESSTFCLRSLKLKNLLIENVFLILTSLKHKHETANELWKPVDERVYCYNDQVFFLFIPIYNGYKLTKYEFKSRTEAAISSAGICLK